MTSFPNRAEDCPGSLSISRDKAVHNMLESLCSVPREYPGAVGNLTLVPIGLFLDLLGQFLDLLGLFNNFKREDINVHLLQLITELVG